MRIRTYTAAGGVVLDAGGHVLLIERDVTRAGVTAHEVRLPKGHVEPGETDEEAARREVCEETGYCSFELIADLGTTLTEFSQRDEWVQRTEHYFLMRLIDPERGEPQFDSPDAEEARFLPLWATDLVEAEMRLTFPSESQFARRAQEVARPKPDHV